MRPALAFRMGTRKFSTMTRDGVVSVGTHPLVAASVPARTGEDCEEGTVDSVALAERDGEVAGNGLPLAISPILMVQPVRRELCGAVEPAFTSGSCQNK